MESYLRDVRYAARGLVRTPGFAVVAVLTLALGIGANTAIFSVVNAVVLRPLPFAKPDRLVRVWPSKNFTVRQLVGIEEGSRSYLTLAGASPTSLTLTGDGIPEELSASVVGTSHLDVFGVTPALGRGFVTDDSKPGGVPIAILSHELWQRRFGGDQLAIGRTVQLGGEGATARTIVGVMPPGYRPFTWTSEVFVPLVLEPGTHDYTDMGRFTLVGRLRDDASTVTARSELRIVAGRLVDGIEVGYIGHDEVYDLYRASFSDIDVTEVEVLDVADENTRGRIIFSRYYFRHGGLQKGAVSIYSTVSPLIPVFLIRVGRLPVTK